MSLVVATIYIDAPPQAVWDMIMDPARTVEWVTIARGVEHVDDGPLHEGFRMDQILCLRGVNFRVKWSLEELDEPWMAKWKGRGPARSTARIDNRLSERDGGTHFEYRNEFKAPMGPLGAVASRAVVGGIPDREANTSLQRLKQILEQ